MEMQEWLNWIVPTGTVLAALISARASKISANAAKRANRVAFEALEANRKIAENDWRIRLMDERMQVWRAFDELMLAYVKGLVTHDVIDSVEPRFQKAAFLFDEEVSDFLNELIFNMLLFIQNQKWLMSGAVVMTREEDREQIHGKRLKEKMRIEAWLHNQQQGGKDLFKKHMSLLD
ncbi:hypothetical protein NFK58_12890 [Citrobacter portucalensis]|uniref:hypothetical protein n=1 Tax=Citrobacter portucalensis TaxID=1639133 RepID=UPI00242A8C36|nr:hypothetical protein [Citrobacter portucalensis]WFZ22204.1 hypothetical protein NFK58_12890 [Citrobacter portucalensis]